MRRQAGDVTCVPSLDASAIKEKRQENTILFQTLVCGAVMTIRPPTSSIDDRKHLGADLFQPPWGHNPLASTSGVGLRSNRGGLDGATTSIHCLSRSCRHAALRASMTRLSMNQFNQTSGVSTSGACETLQENRRATRAKLFKKLAFSLSLAQI